MGGTGSLLRTDGPGIVRDRKRSEVSTARAAGGMDRLTSKPMASRSCCCISRMDLRVSPQSIYFAGISPRLSVMKSGWRTLQLIRISDWRRPIAQVSATRFSKWLELFDIRPDADLASAVEPAASRSSSSVNPAFINWFWLLNSNFRNRRFNRIPQRQRSSSFTAPPLRRVDRITGCR